MKYWILLLCFVVGLKVADGQVCDLSEWIYTFNTDTPQTIVSGYGGQFSVEANLLHAGAADMAIRGINTALNKVGLTNWLVLEQVVFSSGYVGRLYFRVAKNETGEARTAILRCRNVMAVVQPVPQPYPKVFPIKYSGTKIFPQLIHPVVGIDSSERDVVYSLRHNGQTCDTMTGTGGAIRFRVSQSGKYTISAQRGYEKVSMQGQVEMQYFALASADYYFTSPAAGVVADGAVAEACLMVRSALAGIYQQELVEITQAVWQGLSFYDWDSDVRIMYIGYKDGYRLLFYVPVSLSAENRTFPFVLGDPSLQRTFTIHQQGGGEVKAYRLSGPACASSGEGFRLQLSGFQWGVTYEVMKNGSRIGSFSNVNYYQCNDGAGEYTVYACYKNIRRPMSNSWTVLDRELYSHYVLTRTYIDTLQSVCDVVYYDNLSRPIQRSAVGASPSGKDIVTPQQYDAAGRISRQWLPYATDAGGTLRRRFGEEQTAFYASLYGPDAYAYSDVVYDDSPRRQVVERSAPGASWRLGGGHTRWWDTRTNISSDPVRQYRLLGTSVICSGIWAPGTLSVRRSVDPEQRESFEYYNTEGHLVAKEARLSASDSRFTCYVYDDFGRLRYVLPPAQTAVFTSGTKSLADLSALCYYTEYDRYGRVYRQYVPGAGYTVTLYDKRNRPVLTQDARQRSRTPEEWSFTKYDEWNRPVISGVCDGTETAHTSALAAQTVFAEERGAALHGYTNQTYPTAVTTDRCLNVTYYDDYTWSGNNNVSFSTADALGQQKSDDVKGQATGRKTKVLGIATDQWLLSATYYDSRYRTMQEVSQLYPSGTEVTTNVSDYIGNITQVKVKQTVDSQITEYNKYYSYDHRGRLLKVEQQMTGDPHGKITLASYTYDELGRQTGKKLHNDSYPMTFAYQVGGNLSVFNSKDLTYMLSYDTLAVPVSGAVAKYDGNISCLRWKNNNTPFKSYTYAYDALGQLTNALYNEQSGSTWSNPANKFNVNGIDYDRNGNLKSLIRRNLSGGILHNLVYHYDLTDNGNALSSVTLNGGASGAFVYDANGNLTTDGLRGITIKYNELNLPAEISKGSEKISYIYSASGAKLAMQVGSSLTYYRDVMVYNGNTLSYVLHPAGIIRRSGTAWVYDYMLPDHTGSTRVLLEASSNTLSAVQITDYYPFGLSFANNNLDKNKYLFSGKELQDGMLGGSILGWYDFGARMYNPVLGRWFCQDPALQLVSPYGYCGNNPVCYVDADGRWFWLIPMAIGGVINVISNWDNIGDFWQGLAVFGAGAASGGLSMLGPLGAMGGGLLTGTVNSSIQDGQWSWSWERVGISAGVGLVSSFVGGQAGKLAVNKLSFVVNGSNSPLLKGAFAGAVGGATGGYAAGFTGGFMTSGSFKSAHEAGLHGMASGAWTGTISGMGSAYAEAKSRNINPWNGKRMDVPVRIPDFSPDPDGDNIVLYWGMTGNENPNKPLFVTDDPAYARSYSGEVRQVTVNRLEFKRLMLSGGVTQYEGRYGQNGGNEYKIVNKYLSQYILSEIKK